MKPTWRYRLRHILPHYQRHIVAFALGFLLLAATNASSAAIPYVIKLAIDALTNQEPIHLWALLLVALATVNGWVRTASRVFVYRIGRQVEYELRRAYHAKLMELDAPFFHKQRTGDLVSRGTNDITAVRMFIGPGFLQTANAVMIYTVTLPVMASIDPLLTLLALLPFPLTILLSRRITQRLYRLSRAVADQFGILSGFVQETVSGSAVVRAHAQEENWNNRFAAVSEELFKRHARHGRSQSLFSPLTTLSGGVAALIILFHGGHQVVAGTLTIGDFAAFIGYLAMLLWPTVGLGWIFTVMQRGIAALERIGQVLDAEPSFQPPQPATQGVVPRWQGYLTVRNLCFSFHHLHGQPGDGPETLRNLSFTLPAGSFIGLVGRVGSGKSALLGALARIHPVPAGTIHIDGQPLETIPEAELRRNLAYVPQESFLFSTTVRENLLFGLPDGGDDLAWEIARQAALDKEVTSFPAAMETIVGERGITLSGGQRQRVALARALAVNPVILLLDDVFSSVDARTEALILDEIRRYATGRTVVMVCQRIAALHHADAIYLMEQGAIIASGRHEELLDSSSLYRELHDQMARLEALESLR